MAKAVLAPAKEHKVLGGEAGAKTLTDRPVQNGMRMRHAVEQKRNVQHAEFRQHTWHAHACDKCEVDAAKLHALH